MENANPSTSGPIGVPGAAVLSLAEGVALKYVQKPAWPTVRMWPRYKGDPVRQVHAARAVGAHGTPGAPVLSPAARASERGPGPACASLAVTAAKLRVNPAKRGLVQAFGLNGAPGADALLPVAAGACKSGLDPA